MEAVWFSALTGGATLLGTISVLRFQRIPSSWVAASLGLAATVMLFVSLFELLPAALMLRPRWVHVGVGMGSAVALMTLMEQMNRFNSKPTDSPVDYRRLGWMLVGAVIAHNLPEGAAIGIGFRVEPELGLTLTLAMAVHNLPEGVGMAAPLLKAGIGAGRIFLIGFGAAASLPIGTWLGRQFLAESTDLVVIGLIFAATTMIWVVTQEVLHRALEMSSRATRWGIAWGILLSFAIHALHG
ncbi:MAG: ZIP family metal transporter [Firmicutes bacterium]|nr:ZIP family metal transporter [Melghirimyces thermohalophilus]MDA8353753.1 ZIP family metal transporter [Bacillota bacterium]